METSYQIIASLRRWLNSFSHATSVNIFHGQTEKLKLPSVRVTVPPPRAVMTPLLVIVVSRFVVKTIAGIGTEHFVL